MRRVLLVITLTAWATCVNSLAAQEKAAKHQSPPAEPTGKVPAKEEGPPWTNLFDGKEMTGWEVVKGLDYEDAGKVEIKEGSLVLGMGDPATGVRWTGKFPKVNYEVELEGQRVEGSDFFCGMSFPVGDGALTLILGGWGGWMTGLSCVDGYRAIDNETCSSTEFKNKQWYRIRVRVTKSQVSAYVDDQRICQLETAHRKLTVTSEMEPCLPLGIATWVTAAALRNIRYRALPEDAQSGDNTPR